MKKPKMKINSEKELCIWYLKERIKLYNKVVNPKTIKEMVNLIIVSELEDIIRVLQK